MGKRYLDCTSSEIAKMDGKQLVEAIAGSEGRVLVCETIGAVRPMLGDVTNAEFAAAMGADLLILNLFDVNEPLILGLPDTAPEDTIREVKRLTGRAVGINLEPLETDVESSVETNAEWQFTSGRAATVENARKAIEMGVDFIVLTGNPGVGVTNSAIIHTLRKFRKEFGDRIMLIAGKCMRQEFSRKAEKILLQKRIQERLPVRARMSYSCRRRGQFRALLQSISGSWYPVPISWGN